MFAHLPTCDACRGYFERYLTLTRLDPRALPAEQRIARGLGLAVTAPDLAGRRTWLAAAVLAPIAVAIAFAIRIPGTTSATPPPARPASFTARGLSSGGTPALWTYRLGPGPSAHLVDRVIHADDDLAFAYSNPSGKGFLMVFGVDEQRRVYWFHPAWPVGAPPPLAVRAAEGPGPHELTEAIRHQLEPGAFRIHALFCDRPLSATTVEAAVRSARDLERLLIPGGDVVTLTRTLEVRP
jgi:hypothetical protein